MIYIHSEYTSIPDYLRKRKEKREGRWKKGGRDGARKTQKYIKKNVSTLLHPQKTMFISKMGVCIHSFLYICLMNLVCL